MEPPAKPGRFILRGQRVILDRDLAALYGVTTRRLNEAIAAILSAIRQLMHPPPAKRRGIGFTADIRNPQVAAATALDGTLWVTTLSRRLSWIDQETMQGLLHLAPILHREVLRDFR